MYIVIIDTVLKITIPIFITAFILYIYRAIKGPTISDQILAIDAMSYDLAVFFVILSILLKNPVLVGVALVLALWIYALDIYVAKFLEKREMGD
ncbi:MAG: monovalent cation/H+ antiporter complex subunit F [Desulfurococcaceae archaeon]